MTDPKQESQDAPDFDKAAKDMMELVSKSQNVFMEIMNMSAGAAMKNMEPKSEPVDMDPLNANDSMKEAVQKLAMNPTQLMEANMNLWAQHMTLWQQASASLIDPQTGPTVNSPQGDSRFRHPDWEENPMFSYIKQSYLITSQWLIDTMAGIDGLDEATQHKVNFYTKQLADAFAPTNFLWSNPEVLRATMESGGENLVKGLQNYQRDMELGGGKLKMTMSKEGAFTLGGNLANTPGKVVFQNDLIQLLQYTPTTAEAYEVPLVIVPPWINKYYILDLGEQKSFIKWAVAQGYTVFLVSWVNPDETLADKRFEDYMHEGIIAAIDAAQKATGCNKVSTIGYCIGGTMLAATLAYMAATGDDRVAASTFFAAQVDFSEAGDLKVFIDEAQLQNLDGMMEEKGYLEADKMYTTFNMLRSNDLIWSFYVNNYLLGKDPVPFDLLHWNNDATRLPRKCHMFYLRNMYMENNLVKPGAIEFSGVPLDLSKIDIPIYLQASREDHIAPYPSVFKATHHYSGPVRFVMAGSGHIAGVINPPSKNKYQYWLNDEMPLDVEDWVAGATEYPGSWWGDWDQWLSSHSGNLIKAPVPGDSNLKVIEDAPGSYAMG